MKSVLGNTIFSFNNSCYIYIDISNMELNQLNDTVHSQIVLPDICIKIIHTKHFQRLKKLKQLGGVYFVYPSASHNRYEHCIGTSYLAGVYGKQLQTFLRSNPDLDLSISDEEIEVVQIAALCHDLGHGPLSHCWERVMKSVIDAKQSEDPKINQQYKYSHEDMSCLIFKHMATNCSDIEEALAHIKKKITEIGDIDIVALVQDMIKGVKPEDLLNKPEFYKRKYFLFQIVSNESSKIDVDKFDYMLRDSKFLNLNVTLDYKRIIHNTGIGKDYINGEAYNVLIYRRKISHTLEELFSDRMIMHRKAYQHPRNVLLEQMFVDGFKLVKDHFKLYSDKGEYFFRDFVDNSKEGRIDAFLETTDNLVDLIKQDYYKQKVDGIDEPKLKPAVDLFNRVENGNHYTLIGYFLVTNKKDQELYNIINEAKKKVDEDHQKLIKEVKKNAEEQRQEIINETLHKIRINFGSTLEMAKTIAGFGTETYHPLKNVKFFYYEHENGSRSIKFSNPPEYPEIPPNEIKYLIYVKEKLNNEEISSMRKQLIKASENQEYKDNGLLFVPE